MNANLAALLYLVAGVLFILALRGLSSPETSRRGNQFGMIGMLIAVLTTLAAHPPAGVGAWVMVVAGLAIGGSGGAGIARRGAGDKNAGAGCGVPLAGRHGGGAGCGGGAVCAVGVRHRHGGAHPRLEPDRDVARG